MRAQASKHDLFTAKEPTALVDDLAACEAAKRERRAVGQDFDQQRPVRESASPWTGAPPERLIVRGVSSTPRAASTPRDDVFSAALDRRVADVAGLLCRVEVGSKLAGIPAEELPAGEVDVAAEQRMAGITLGTQPPAQPPRIDVKLLG